MLRTFFYICLCSSSPLAFNSCRMYVDQKTKWADQDETKAGFKDEVDTRYEDAPFGMFVRFGGGRGGLWFRYKGHVRPSSVKASRTLPSAPCVRPRGQNGK